MGRLKVTSDVRKKHLEKTKGSMVSKAKNTPLLIGEYCNSADPISTNHLYNLFYMEFRVDTLRLFN